MENDNKNNHIVVAVIIRDHKLFAVRQKWGYFKKMWMFPRVENWTIINIKTSDHLDTVKYDNYIIDYYLGSVENYMVDIIFERYESPKCLNVLDQDNPNPNFMTKHIEMAYFTKETLRTANWFPGIIPVLDKIKKLL